MAEWSKALVLKTNISFLKISWVRIPLHPFNYLNYIKNMLYKRAFIYHWEDCKVKLYFLSCSFLSTLIINFVYRLEIFYLIGKVFIVFQKEIIFTNVTAGLWVYLKLAILGSIVVLIPLIFYFMFLFLLKGFKSYQSSFLFNISIIFIFFCFITISLSFYYLFPFIFSFFLNFENPRGLISLCLEARFDQYVLFVLRYLMIIIGLLFIPTFLLIMHFLVLKKTRKLRRVIYGVTSLALLIIAPPDFFLQFFFILILILTVECLLWLFYILTFLFENLIEESRIRTCDE